MKLLTLTEIRNLGVDEGGVPANALARLHLNKDMIKNLSEMPIGPHPARTKVYIVGQIAPYEVLETAEEIKNAINAPETVIVKKRCPKCHEQSI